MAKDKEAEEEVARLLDQREAEDEDYDILEAMVAREGLAYVLRLLTEVAEAQLTPQEEDEQIATKLVEGLPRREGMTREQLIEAMKTQGDTSPIVLDQPDVSDDFDPTEH